MVLVVLGGLVAYPLMALEGLVALFLVVPEALEVYLPVALEVLVVRKALVVLLPEALVVLTVLIPEINPPWADFTVVLPHNNLSISLLTVLLVLICSINTTSMSNLIAIYLS